MVKESHGGKGFLVFSGLILLSLLVIWAWGPDGYSSVRSDPKQSTLQPQPIQSLSQSIGLSALNMMYHEWATGSPTPLEVQLCLQSAGYDIGPSGADGTIGPATKAALQSFAQDQKTWTTLEKCMSGVRVARERGVQIRVWSPARIYPSQYSGEKTQYVRGYYRKNGTWVNPYWRGRP